MGRISALTELTSLASDDYLVVLDSSANIAKKISVANAFGIPDFGWTASGESWTYTSWNSTTRIGTITVPTDATVKYNAGMRIKITQSTGGTKYGIIHKVEATLLTVFFNTGTTLNNEAITSPSYSIAKNPLGFPTNPRNWMLEYTTTTRQTQASPTSGTIYQLGGTLQVGIGVYEIEHYTFAYSARGAAGPVEFMSNLSTANNTVPNDEFRSALYVVGVTEAGNDVHGRKTVDVTSTTTFYLNILTPVASINTMSFLNDFRAQFIRATSAYL